MGRELNTHTSWVNVWYWWWFWRSGDRASRKILIIKPTRCTNFSNLFLEQNSICFRQFLCPSSGAFHCTYSNSMSYRFADSLLASCQQTPDDGQRKCLKHVDFYSKDKFEELVCLVGCIIRRPAIVNAIMWPHVCGLTAYIFVSSSCLEVCIALLLQYFSYGLDSWWIILPFCMREESVLFSE